MDRKFFRSLSVLALALVAVGCGGTRVKVTNNSGLTLSAVAIQATAGGYSAQFTNILTGQSSDALNWDDKVNLTVTIACTGATCTTTTNPVLQADKTNVFTVPSGGGTVTLTYE